MVAVTDQKYRKIIQSLMITTIKRFKAIHVFKLSSTRFLLFLFSFWTLNQYLYYNFSDTIIIDWLSMTSLLSRKRFLFSTLINSLLKSSACITTVWWGDTVELKCPVTLEWRQCGLIQHSRSLCMSTCVASILATKG